MNYNCSIREDVLTAMIKAQEIQGCIAPENPSSRVGLTHVVLVQVASTAVIARLLGLSRDEIINAVSPAWVDGQSLRTYRHAPNTSSRKSWDAGDATSRGSVGAHREDREIGYPLVLTASTWGCHDVRFKICSDRVRPADRSGSGEDDPRRIEVNRTVSRGHRVGHHSMD